MNSTPPFVAQERFDACALACLRMILAFQGKEITEAELVQATDLHEGGLTPEEVSRLANRYLLQTTFEQADQDRLFELVQEERFPIVFLYRRPIDGADMTHAVIPVRLSRRYITVLDPLRGQRRVSITKFEEARRLVGRWLIVWQP